MNTLIYTVQIMNAEDKDDNLTLGILETIVKNDGVTQRHIANELNVALGLANSYLKRCVRKGLVKIHQAPANRYFYYLTPKGFTEKSRLTAKYLSTSFDFYRKAGNSYRQLFNIIQNNGDKTILFCGISELAEIASLRIKDFELEHIASYEADFTQKEFLKKPVFNNFSEIKGVDACVITTFNKTEHVYRETSKNFEKEKILIPEFLGLNI